MTSDPSEVLHFCLECRTASEVTRLAVCGNWQGWSLAGAINLKYTEDEGEGLAELLGICARCRCLCCHRRRCGAGTPTAIWLAGRRRT